MLAKSWFSQPFLEEHEKELDDIMRYPEFRGFIKFALKNAMMRELNKRILIEQDRSIRKMEERIRKTNWR